MQPTDLKSRTWCDTVFERRNKEYGAYRLRQQAGARYGLALWIVVLGGLFFFIAHNGYLHLVRKQNRQDMAEIEKTLAKMIPSELNNGYQIRMVSTGRAAHVSRQGETEKASGMPVISDQVTHAMVTEAKQAIRFTADTEWSEEPLTDLMTDTTATDTPVLPQIIRPDDVSTLPEFPGGAREFMRWLDANLVYPPYCRKREIEGDVTVSFIVQTDGYPTDFKVVESTHVLFAQTALNALKRMPQWKAAVTPQGEKTAAMVTVPILFRK